MAWCEMASVGVKVPQWEWHGLGMTSVCVYGLNGCLSVSRRQRVCLG